MAIVGTKTGGLWILIDYGESNIRRIELDGQSPFRKTEKKIDRFVAETLQVFPRLN